MQEVRGSIPLGSTIYPLKAPDRSAFLVRVFASAAQTGAVFPAKILAALIRAFSACRSRRGLPVCQNRGWPMSDQFPVVAGGVGSRARPASSKSAPAAVPPPNPAARVSVAVAGCADRVDGGGSDPRCRGTSVDLRSPVDLRNSAASHRSHGPPAGWRERRRISRMSSGRSKSINATSRRCPENTRRLCDWSHPDHAR